MTNRQAWATAKAGRVATVRAARAALNALKREGIARLCVDSEEYGALCETENMSAQLASDFPANYWLWYPYREPEDFDSTKWVAEKANQCRALARQAGRQTA